MLAAKSASVSLKASTSRPALPCRAAFSRPCVRAQAAQSESDVVAQVSKAAALSAVASSWLMAGHASAATELAQVAASDGRVGTIATLFVPVLGWVGFNMLQPVLAQINRQAEFSAEVAAANSDAKAPAPKRLSKKRSVAAAVGLGAALTLAMASPEQADAASELAQVAASDGRFGTIATLFVPVLGWVGFNMLQPVLSQINRQAEFSAEVAAANSGAKAPAPKRLAKKRSVVGAVGAAGAVLSLMSAEQADAATELAQVAASDGRLGVIGLLFLPVLGWVGFNILQPALNQIQKQAEFANDGASKSIKAVAKKAVKKVLPKRK